MISVRDSYYLGVNSGSSYPKAAQALAYFLSSEGCQYQRMETLGWVPSHMMVLQEAKDYPSVTAVYRQLNYSVSRKVISDELWMPMGVVICFGTLFTLPLTVTILPVVYWKAYAHKDESAGV